MIKKCAYILSLTWLFWLYFGLFSFPSPSSRSEKQVPAPIAQTPQPSPPVSSPSPSSVVSKAEDPSPEIASNSLEPWLEIHLSQRLVTLYQGGYPIKSYPIAVGQSGWETPKGTFKVLTMEEKPNWIHPLTNQVIRNDNPKNPLGPYWIGFWTDGTNWVGFHGTPDPKSVGQAVSHGCIRMYNEDISELFYQVSPGTRVVVKP
jgi:lipoprotein-anchoring transpeptidase ErfK/SrfK